MTRRRDSSSGDDGLLKPSGVNLCPSARKCEGNRSQLYTALGLSVEMAIEFAHSPKRLGELLISRVSLEKGSCVGIEDPGRRG